MTADELHVSAGVAARLRHEALQRGMEPGALAEQAILAFLDQDPFEFIGSIHSSEVTGREADRYLRSSNFGS